LIREGVLRIIDANSNRAREGVRVAEDITRFILGDGELASRWKDVRHGITAAAGGLAESFSDFRDSVNDPGKNSDSPGEMERAGCLDICGANAKRAEEGIRALEEFSKLVSSSPAGIFRELRFKVYTLEKETLSALKKLQPEGE
jgi:thiamine-phosphate pyrophosphorylase